MAQQQEMFTFLTSTHLYSVGTYRLGKTIGEGTFGKVKLAVHKLTGQQVAIKIVDKIHAPALVREVFIKYLTYLKIETWRGLRHPNVVQLYEVLCTESKIFMVTEYCNGGEAFEYITKNGRMDDDSIEAKSVFRQIVEAVAHCHEKGLTHR
jgi:serine/threonine protein kinase